MSREPDILNFDTLAQAERGMIECRKQKYHAVVFERVGPLLIGMTRYFVALDTFTDFLLPSVRYFSVYFHCDWGGRSVMSFAISDRWFLLASIERVPRFTCEPTSRAEALELTYAFIKGETPVAFRPTGTDDLNLQP